MSNYWHIKKVFANEGFSSAHIPILVYHNIIADNTQIHHSRYAVSENQFESQMRFLYDHGYSCLNLANLFQSLNMKELKRKKTFTLTFDDGFEDFYSRAYPILRKYGFTATVFVVTNLIERENDQSNETEGPRMNWEQIKALSSERISFGSHTCSHARLPDLKDEQIRNELIASKECLEAGLEQEITTLAYPYGESSPATREIAMEVGYQAAFGVGTGEPSRFNLWRTEIGASDSMRTFAFKLTSWYRYYIKLRGWVRESTAIGRYLRRVKIHYRRAFNSG